MSLTVFPRIASHLILIAALSSAAVASANDVRAQTTSQASPQVRYRQAHAAFKAGKWTEARELLLGLWKEETTYDVAVTLVQTEYQLQHYAAAARYLQFSLANIPPTEDPSTAQDYKEQLDELRPRIASVNVQVDVDGVELFVADEKVGQSPLKGPVFLEPGNVTLEARLGEKRDRKELKTIAGGSYSVAFKLSDPTPAVVSPGLATGPSTPATQAVRPGQPVGAGNDRAGNWWTAERTAALGIGGGLTLLAAGVAIAFRVDAGNKQDSVDRLKAQAQQELGGPCPTSSEMETCRQLSNAASDRNSASTASRVSFGVTGVLAAATVTTLFLLPSERRTAGTSVAPVVGPGFAGLSVNGAF